MSWQSAIKARMKKYDISQADLACSTGKSRSYISEIVNGKKKGLKLEVVAALAKALKTNGPNLWREATKADGKGE